MVGNIKKYNRELIKALKIAIESNPHIIVWKTNSLIKEINKNLWTGTNFKLKNPRQIGHILNYQNTYLVFKNESRKSYTFIKKKCQE